MRQSNGELKRKKTIKQFFKIKQLCKNDVHFFIVKKKKTN